MLGKEEKITKATNLYTDDILVDETMVTTEEVKCLLRKYGLVVKPSLKDRAALGLKLQRQENWYSREGILLVGKALAKGLFSIYVKLVEHCLVADSLKVACSYMRRQAETNG